jgi:hypothetical protein
MVHPAGGMVPDEKSSVSSVWDQTQVEQANNNAAM